MEANDPWGVASLKPKGMVDTVYMGDNSEMCYNLGLIFDLN